MRRLLLLGLVAVVAGLAFAPKGPPSEASQLADWSTPPPWPVFTAGTWLLRAVDSTRQALMPPPIRVLEEALSFSRSQVTYVLAKLAIPDLLASGAKTAAQLAPLTGVAVASELDRVLSLGVALGMLGAASNGSTGPLLYHNNRFSAAMRSDHPNDVRHLVLSFIEDSYTAWRHLVPGLQQGKNPFQLASGQDIWDYFKANPTQEDQFSKAMTAVDALGMKAVVQDYHWGRHRRVLDIGGAYGSALAAILEPHPHLSGVLFDLPQVVERAEKLWNDKRQHLLNRTTFKAGSFFEEGSVPAAGSDDDVFVMRVVLHDWDDEKTVQILEGVRAAMGGHTNATLAIVEVTPTASPLQERIPGRRVADIHMHTMCSGKERTEVAWRELLPQAGLKLVKVHPTRGAMSVIEAAPAS